MILNNSSNISYYYLVTSVIYASYIACMVEDRLAKHNFYSEPEDRASRRNVDPSQWEDLTARSCTAGDCEEVYPRIRKEA